MLKRIGLIFNTLKWLKPIQIYYQVYYRLKRTKKLSYYRSKHKVSFRKLDFSCEISIVDQVKASRFEFLKITKEFDEIDWNFLEYGKLWNYNLQYFNYIHQNNIDRKEVELWLLSIDDWLATGHLELEPYPVSLRIMNVIRYYSKHGGISDLVADSMYAQSEYLNENCEYHLLGNHLLENAFALMMSGAAFRNIEWREKAQEILKEQLNEQILSDGAHFELSPMYHQIILFRLLELIDWYKTFADRDEGFLSFLQTKAKLMMRWLKKMTFTNGDVPHFNDSANGIALSSFELFEIANKLELQSIKEMNLSTSGFRRYDGDSYECIIDVGELGASYQAGHSHADALSYVLYNDGKPFITEVGTSTYQIGLRRDYERSTLAHNTVSIGGENQSEVWGGFRAGSRATTKVLEEGKSLLIASHDGFFKKFGVVHKRSFNFKPREICIYDDTQDQEGIMNLHFHPSCSVKVISQSKVLIGEFAEIYFSNARNMSKEQYSHSSGFNSYTNAYKLSLSFTGQLTTTIKFIK